MVSNLELFDNGVDAQASCIDIKVLEEGILLGGGLIDESGSGRRLLTDNGRAMRRADLHKCLSLGHTESSAERIGMVRSRAPSTSFSHVFFLAIVWRRLPNGHAVCRRQRGHRDEARSYSGGRG